jgi:hypothetical protein
MSFYEHATTFAGRPVVEVEAGGPLPAVEGPVAWRVAVWEYDGTAREGDESEEFREAFEAFAEQAGDRVEALVIGAWGYAAFNDPPIEQLCAAATRLPRLRALFLGDQTSEECEVSWMRMGDFSRLLAAYPDLEILRVRGGRRLSFRPVKHGALRELAIETGGLPGEVVRAVLASELPALTGPELWFGDGNYGGDTTVADLGPLLDGTALPSVERLGLRNAEYADDLAVALAGAPIVPRLATLDLSLGTLGDAGAEALLAGQPMTHLSRLDLHHHYLSGPVAERLIAALPGVTVDVSEAEEADQYDGEEIRYTAVSE